MFNNQLCFCNFRIYVAGMHFNENSQNKQAVRADGQRQWAMSYPKRKKGTEAVVKPVKTATTFGMCIK